MSEQDRWSAVDAFLVDRLIPRDEALEAALATSAAAGLPNISVSPTQGKLLNLLARSLNVKRILEIGTLGGYSTIWLARGLSPGGKLITLESDARHAQIARSNLSRAGLQDTVELVLGRAIDTLPTLAGPGPRGGPFDLVFIDADKPSTADYFDWSIKLSRPGAMIVVDNVIRTGKVIDADSEDAAVQGVRRFYDRLASDKRVTATAIQTVGQKGYDGFALALVTSV